MAFIFGLCVLICIFVKINLEQCIIVDRDEFLFYFHFVLYIYVHVSDRQNKNPHASI